MKPSELTRAGLIKWGGESVYQQAEALVKRGGVLKAEMKDDGWITGVIARETGEVYTKLRAITPERIDSHCPCFTNRHSGHVCMHVVALGIHLMMRYTDPLRQQKYVEDQRRAKRMEQLDDMTLVRDPHGTPARLALTVPATWVDLFRAGHVPVNIMLLTARDVLMPEQLPQDLTFALSKEDDNLLGVLEDICEGPPKNTNDMVAIDFLNVLAVASHTRIAVAGKRELAIHPVSVETHLRVAVNEVSGELTVYPEATLPFTLDTEPTWLVCNHSGWMLVEDELYPIKNVLPIPYHGIYASKEIIPRSDVMNFLKRSLPSLTSVIPVEMALTPDLFVEIPGNPLFRLELKGSRASLRAQLKAVYGDQAFVAGMPYAQAEFAMPDPEDILTYRTRNLNAEKNALKMLLAHGFEEDPDSAADGSYTMVGVREVLNFLGTGYQTLGRFGWKIDFSPRLRELVESIPAITPVVQISEKRNGWFDVGFTFELPGRGGFPATEIQRAINRGDAWLESNGETMLIDRDAVEAMRSIFSDCRSRPGETAGHFEMSPIYAPFVQSSLQAIDGVDVEDPPDWRDQAAERNRSNSTQLKPVPLGVLENILRPYQKEGVYWLRFIEESGLNGILADEMGLGKTLQTLTWLSLPRVDMKAQKKPALIVCPTSLVENWKREAEQFVPHLKCLVISGSDRAELFSKIQEYDMVVTSYALLRRDMEQYEAFQFSVAVLDEAQHIKNRSTQNAVAAKQINAINRLVLTGTPVENSVADLWSIMDYLMPQYLANTRVSVTIMNSRFRLVSAKANWRRRSCGVS